MPSTLQHRCGLQNIVAASIEPISRTLNHLVYRSLKQKANRSCQKKGGGQYTVYSFLCGFIYQIQKFYVSTLSISRLENNVVSLGLSIACTPTTDEDFYLFCILAFSRD